MRNNPTMLFLVIVGLMVGIALASYFYERRHGKSGASRGNEAEPDGEDGFANEEHDDFDAGADGD